jgi:hypothetical protein
VSGRGLHHRAASANDRPLVTREGSGRRPNCACAPSFVVAAKPL